MSGSRSCSGRLFHNYKGPPTQGWTYTIVCAPRYSSPGVSRARERSPRTVLILIQKTYQFINVVNGVSHLHKTANIFFSFDSVA